MKKNLKVAEELKKFRIRKGMTQKDIADRVGVSRSVWSFLENAQQPLKMQHIIAIKDKLGFDVTPFIHGEDGTHPTPTVNEPQPYFGEPVDMPKDIGQFMEYMNQVREARKDINIVINLLKDLRTNEPNISLNSKKIIDQSTNILLQASMLL